VDTSASTDSLSSASTAPLALLAGAGATGYGTAVAGVTPPRSTLAAAQASLARRAGAFGPAAAAEAQAQRLAALARAGGVPDTDRQGGSSLAVSATTDADSGLSGSGDELEAQLTAGGGGLSRGEPGEYARAARAAEAERRRRGVFRLQAYGAQRRKLMQQVRASAKQPLPAAAGTRVQPSAVGTL
jgi:hypothetical protein